MSEPEKAPPEARNYVVTIESKTGAAFLQLVGSDVRNLHDVLQSLQKQRLKYDDVKPTLWKEPLLEGDPETGDGQLVVTNPHLVVAVSTMPQVDELEEYDDEDEEGGEFEDADRPDDMTSKAKQKPFRLAATE